MSAIVGNLMKEITDRKITNSAIREKLYSGTPVGKH